MSNNNKPVAYIGDKTCGVGNPNSIKYSDITTSEEFGSFRTIPWTEYTLKIIKTYIRQYKLSFKYDHKRFMRDILHPIKFYKFIKKTGGHHYIVGHYAYR